MKTVQTIKALHLTTAARMQSSVGQTTNLVAIDSEKLFQAVLFCHFIWHGPVCCIVVMGILISQVGSVLVVLVVAVVVVVVRLLLVVKKSSSSCSTSVAGGGSNSNSNSGSKISSSNTSSYVTSNSNCSDISRNSSRCFGFGCSVIILHQKNLK